METPKGESLSTFAARMGMLGATPQKMDDPKDREALQALFRRLRNFAQAQEPIFLPASAPTAEFTQEMKDLIEFAEWTAGKEIPKWHRDILLGMERDAPRMQVADLMFNIPVAETSEAGKFLTITRAKSREGAVENLAINPTRLRVGNFIKDL